MEKKAAKETQKQALGMGSLTGNEDWVASKDLVSTELLPKLQTKVSNNRKERTVSIKPQDQTEQANIILYTETTGKKKKKTEKACVAGRDKDGNVLWIGKKVRGKGLNGYCLYRKTPAFPGQKPSEDVQDGKEEEEGIDNNSDDDDEAASAASLFLYGRILGVKATSQFCAYTIFSVVTGPNLEAPETSLGCVWKDVYKTIQIPQFQYAACTFDIANGNLVMKSEQKSNVSTLPVFEVAPGVDIPHAILTCTPLLPDGSKIGDAIDVAEDFLWLLLF